MYVAIYVIHCSYHASLITIKSLSFRLYEKARYFQACSNNKIALFFPFTAFLLLVSNKLRKHPGGGARLKNLMLVNFVQ